MSATSFSRGASAPGLHELGSGAALSVPRPAFAWKTRLLLPIGMLLAMALLLGYAARGALLPATRVRVVPVVLHATSAPQATQQAAGASVVAAATGWVEPDPYPVNATALADGIVREVLVLEGDLVEAGQPVAQLVDDEARLAMSGAEASLARAVAELSAAQRRWENPVDREQAVATTAARVAQTRAELSALGPTIEAERARARELAVLVEQLERAYRSNGATETELAIARQRLAAQEATVQATQAQRAVLEAQLAREQADEVAAREEAQLRIAESAALATAEAQVQEARVRRDEAQLRLERMTVRAPAGGTVMTRHAQAGSKLMLAMDEALSATVVRLYDPAKLQVRVDVPLADAAKVGVGMPAEVIVSVLPDRVFRGEVTRVVHEADVARNTLQVKVAILDPAPQLKPEMLARVRFVAPARGQAQATALTRMGVFAPEVLLRNASGDTASALVVDRATDTAVLRQLVLGGGRKDGWVEIASGLAAGDRLIAEPPGVEDGDRVRVIGEAEAGHGGTRGVH